MDSDGELVQEMKSFYMGQPWLLVYDNPYITAEHQGLENKMVSSLPWIDKKKE